VAPGGVAMGEVDGSELHVAAAGGDHGTGMAWRSAEVEDEVKLDGAYVGLKCFRCFRRTLQVFCLDVASLMRDLNVPCNMK